MLAYITPWALCLLMSQWPSWLSNQPSCYDNICFQISLILLKKVPCSDAPGCLAWKDRWTQVSRGNTAGHIKERVHAARGTFPHFRYPLTDLNRFPHGQRGLWYIQLNHPNCWLPQTKRGRSQLLIPIWTSPVLYFPLCYIYPHNLWESCHL